MVEVLAEVPPAVVAGLPARPRLPPAALLPPWDEASVEAPPVPDGAEELAAPPIAAPVRPVEPPKLTEVEVEVDVEAGTPVPLLLFPLLELDALVDPPEPEMMLVLRVLVRPPELAVDPPSPGGPSGLALPPLPFVFSSELQGSSGCGLRQEREQPCRYSAATAQSWMERRYALGAIGWWSE